MLRRNVELIGFNSYCVSARAELCFFPADDDELLAVIHHYQKSRLIVLGGGTNIILQRSIYKDPIVVLTGLNQWIRPVDDATLHVGAGVRLGAVVEYANQAGLAGLQSLAGVPGTVGGAIRMNAGAYGQCIGDRIRRVSTVDTATGARKYWDKRSSDFGYRTSAFSASGSIITDALIELEGKNINSPITADELQRQSFEILGKRATRIPYGLPNAGSVFKRADGSQPVGELVERLGLKGHRINDAMVSHQHAGIFVNNGFATGADIINLIADVTSKVLHRYGVTLEPEQVII